MSGLLLVGRIIFGGFFLLNAWNHFRHLKRLAGYAQSKGVPVPALAVFVSGLLFLAGGLSVILGYDMTIGLGAVVLALVPVTFMMHAFWRISDPAQRGMERIQFQKNAAIIGAALMLLALL